MAGLFQQIAGSQQGGPPQSAAERATRSVFVGNIPYEATEEQLKEIFTQAGPVYSFRLVYDRETGKPKGYGFCEYQDTETAQSAMRNLNNYDFNGRPLRVGVAAGEQSKEDMKSMQQASGSGPPVENPFGDEIEAEKAPEAISKAVASLPPEQMFELMKQMKLCIQNNANEARNMLLQNPQLAYALLQAQIVMKIVDPQVAMAMLHRDRSQVPPVMPGGGQGDQPMQIGLPQALQGPGPRGPPQQVGQPGPPMGHPGPQMGQQGPQMGHQQGPPMGQQGPQMGQQGPPMGHQGSPMGHQGQPMGQGPPMGHGGPGPGQGMMQGGPPQMVQGVQPPVSMQGNMPPQGVRMMDPRERPEPHMVAPGRPMGPGDPRDMGPRDMGPRDMGPRDMGPRDMGPRDMGPRDMGAHDMGPRDVGPPFQEPMRGPRPEMRDPRTVMGERNMQPRMTIPAGVRLPAGMLPAQIPTSAPSGTPISTQDQEKAALIMQVLQLTDQQIAMLPPEQRQSILILKDQIAKSAQP